MKCSINRRAASGERRAGRAGCRLLVGCCALLTACCSLLACPLCKDALTQAMAKGFYWSILWMLTVPAVVVGVIAGVLWRAAQKRRGAPAGPHE